MITTAKDHVRLATMPSVPASFLAGLAVLNVELQFERADVLDHILDTTIERFKNRIRK